MFMNDEFERAKEVYLEAIGVSADCLEAIYNLGLVNMHIGRWAVERAQTWSLPHEVVLHFA